MASTVLAASHVIKGKITSASGEPLPGSNITVRGTKNFVTTADANGNYKIEVGSNKSYKITVSYVGYVTQTFNVLVNNGDVDKNVKMVEDEHSLDQVVITATHTAKALKDVPVVTRLITLSDIQKVDATNIQDMLTQELPGLEFGLAMSQETSLNMSGFGGNAVLFLVDGERMAGETMDNVDYNRMNLDNVGRIEKYWYISGISPSSKTRPSNVSASTASEGSTLRIKSVRAPSSIKKGRSYTIKGTVKSNKKIKKVTVRILDVNGNVKLSASKKPNSKSFSIKKLDKKIKFKKLKKGSYTYQIIAKDSVQELMLVNKQFIVR